MNRDTWESKFTHLLQQQLELTTEQIRFHWRGYYNQRFTPEGAVADLKLKHELYPQLGLLPKSNEVTKLKKKEEITYEKF
jgi:hypothetical protein